MGFSIKDVLKNFKKCPKRIPKMQKLWADKKESLVYCLTGFFLFLNQSYTSGSFLVFFKHLELELLELALSGLFFWIGFGWDFSALSFLLWQFLEYQSGLVSPNFRNVWVLQQPWLQAELFYPQTAFFLFLFGVFCGFFPHLEGDPQINALTHSTST